MAIEFTGGAWWPERRTWAFNAPFVNALQPYNLSDGIRTGVVFPAPHTGTLTGIGILLGTVNEVGIPPNPTSVYRFSLQGVNTAGLPNGANQVYGDLPVTAWPIHTWHQIDMTSGTYAATRGEYLACTLEYAVVGQIASGFLTCIQQPANSQGPCWQARWTTADGWLHAGYIYTPLLTLFYEDDTLHGPPDGIMPGAILTRCSSRLITSDPVGMAFTVPRSLRCDGISFHHTPTNGTTLSLYEDDELIAADTVGASTGTGDWAFMWPELVLRPGRAYRAELTSSAGPFTTSGYRTVHGPAGASGLHDLRDVYPDTWPGITHALDDFEGGPTWIAYGDSAAAYDPVNWGPSPPTVDRWFMSLHIPGPALELPDEPPPLVVEPMTSSQSRLHLKIVGAYVP